MRAWRAWPVLLLAIPASVALAADHEVVTVGTSFSPKSIDVAVGDTVTWRNASGGHHNVHFDDGATNGPPATGQWTYPRTFAEAGEYGYMCDFHGPSMSGVVRVGLPPVDTPTPTPTASSVPTPTVTPTPTVGSVPDPSGTPTATPEPGAQPPSVTSLRVQRRARRGRVRVSAVVEPEGIQLTIVVRRGKRVIGRRTLAAPAEGAVSAQVRLGREARRRLRRSGRLRLRVEVVAGTERAATTVRVRP